MGVGGGVVWRLGLERSSCSPRRSAAKRRQTLEADQGRSWMIDQGDSAPALKVIASDGTATDLARPGQPLVLYFYPKDDTSGCTREAQDFTSLAGDFQKAGVRVVGVSRDPMKKHEKFIDKYALSVPLASDEDGRISD